MPPTTPSTPPSTIKIDGTLKNFLEPNEQPLAVVHRHIIGIIGLYLGVLAGIAAVVAFFALVTPDLFDNLSNQSWRFLLAGIVLALAVLILFLFVATYVYRQSRLMITDRNLVQIWQRSLFIRKVSRLSIATVEDVSSDQRGILATIFNYGTLLIQTAGELENFEFKTCPDPNRYAGVIIASRQAYAESLKEKP